MNLQYQHLMDFTTVVSMFAVVVMFLILFEPRCSKRVYHVTLILFLGAFFGGNIYILLVYGLNVLGKYMLLTCTLPSLLYLWIMARDRGGRFFFTFCMVDTVMMWMMMVTNLIDCAVGSEGLVNSVLRLLAIPVMLAATWRFARKSYLALLNCVSRGWWLFAAMTGLFYLTLAIMGVIPTNIRQRPEDMPAFALVLLLLPLTYATIFIVLSQQDKLFHAQERQQILEAQAVIMDRRMEDIRRSEDAIRIERHDMRHHFQTIAALAQNGDSAAVLDYVGKSQEKLDSITPKRYCNYPILDAVLANAVAQAEQAGISTEIAVVLPEKLPVDALELSIVFANALENASQAVKNLPADQRHIICKSVTHPRFIIEISNPYQGTVAFDKQGFPVTEKRGHGIGTRSIIAFAEKYHALCFFRAEKGWFKLQMVL